MCRIVYANLDLEVNKVFAQYYSNKVLNVGYDSSKRNPYGKNFSSIAFISNHTFVLLNGAGI